MKRYKLTFSVELEAPNAKQSWLHLGQVLYDFDDITLLEAVTVGKKRKDISKI